MSMRSRRILAIARNSHILYLPKYETTKGTFVGEQTAALKNINIYEKQQQNPTNQDKKLAEAEDLETNDTKLYEVEQEKKIKQAEQKEHIERELQLSGNDQIEEENNKSVTVDKLKNPGQHKSQKETSTNNTELSKVKQEKKNKQAKQRKHTETELQFCGNGQIEEENIKSATVDKLKKSGQQNSGKETSTNKLDRPKRTISKKEVQNVNAEILPESPEEPFQSSGSEYVLSSSNDESDQESNQISSKAYLTRAECNEFVHSSTAVASTSKKCDGLENKVGELAQKGADATYTYKTAVPQNEQEEILQSLSETEKTLTKKFRRVVTEGKGSKPVAILFPTYIQELIDALLSARSLCVTSGNEYLFANPNTSNSCLSGYHALKKLAEESGVTDKSLFTSTRLRKQIATVLQVMNIGDDEMEQFANFMGHTKKTHESYYRLPQDIYQTAKVSKLLLAINKGKGAKYKGKTLDEIEFSNSEISESDNESAPRDGRNEEQIGVPNTTSNEEKNLENEDDDTGSWPVSTSKARKRTVQRAKRRSEKNISESEDDDTDAETVSTNKAKNCKIRRVRWTEKQKTVITEYFKRHIKTKTAPKKHEVQKLMDEHKTLFKDRTWVKIKAYVYNCYKN